jgi:hypothetical protein
LQNGLAVFRAPQRRNPQAQNVGPALNGALFLNEECKPANLTLTAVRARNVALVLTGGRGSNTPRAFVLSDSRRHYQREETSSDPVSRVSKKTDGT